jgi:hypothetical protein
MPEQEDQEFEAVESAIMAIDGLEQRTVIVARSAIDNVLQGDRTKRYSIAQLSPEEKKHIGTQIENGLRSALFDNRRGATLDTSIAGIEIDIKNTIGSNWMIPPEAVGKLCLLTRINEETRTFSLGLVRTNLELLNSENQDKKRSISKNGKALIRWFVQDAALPVSAFLASDSLVRQQILGQKSGQAGVRELFRNIQKVPIHRSDIEAVAVAAHGRQVDLRARVRDAKNRLAGEGILVLRGWNPTERQEALGRGFMIDKTQCIAIPR